MNMTPEEILEQVQGLPFGPNGKQAVAYLMLSRHLSLDDAVITLEQMAEQSGDAYVAARRRNATGVR